LAANQPQAAAFGQNVAKTLGDQTAAASNAIAPAVNTYTGNLYTVPTDQGVNSLVATSPSSLTPEQQATYQQELGASAAAPNPASTFETTAPYQNLVGDIQNVVEQANLWGAGNNVPALSTALSPFEEAGATTGVRTLDALLLSQTPDAYGRIQTATAPAANLPGQLAAGTNQADAALQAAIAADNAATPAATAAAQSFGTNLTDYLTTLMNSNQAAENSQTSANAALTSDLANKTLTASDAVALGISPTAAQAYADAYNSLNPAIDALRAIEFDPNAARALPRTDEVPLDLSGYLTQGTPPAITMANVATPQNYSDVAALQNLLGANAPPLPISAATADQAGLGLNVNAAAKFDPQASLGAVYDALNKAQTNLDAINASAASDPPQTDAQRAVIGQAQQHAADVITYLNAMVKNALARQPGQPGLV
jgi:hypothetical protein